MAGRVKVPPTSRIPDLDAATAADYDHYFGLERDATSLRDWTIQCVSVEHKLFADLPDTGLTEQSREALRLGFLILYRATLSRWAERTPSVRPDPQELRQRAMETNGHDRPSTATALERWKLGHQVMHVYLVAMVTLLSDLQPRLDDAPPEHISSAFSNVAALFDAVTATMSYASDFDMRTYDQVVRPSMMPPVTPPGFSGSLNVEHRRLIEALPSMLHALAARFGDARELWPAPVLESWSRLDEAHRQTRRHHALICSRFVPEAPSLLRALVRAREGERDNR